MNILGLIAGILGILGSGYDFIEAMGLPATSGNAPVIMSLLAIAFVIAGLVGSTMKCKKKVAGLLMLLGGLGGLLTMTTGLAISYTPVTFFIGLVTAILFIIGGIMSLVKRA